MHLGQRFWGLYRRQQAAKLINDRSFLWTVSRLLDACRTEARKHAVARFERAHLADMLASPICRTPTLRFTPWRRRRPPQRTTGARCQPEPAESLPHAHPWIEPVDASCAPRSRRSCGSRRVARGVDRAVIYVETRSAHDARCRSDRGVVSAARTKRSGATAWTLASSS